MRILRRLLLLAAVLLAVVLLAPGDMGGRTEYVSTYGNSMAPTFAAGDLAVVRSSGSYEVGDIVAYRSPQLDRVVLHRIAGQDGNSFVFKGDNNDFRDPEHLGADHILGRLALRVPQGGTALAWLTNPLHAVAVAAGASVLPAMFVRRRRRSRPNPNTTRGIAMKLTTTTRLRSLRPWFASAGAALLLAGLFGFTRPTTELVDTPVAFTQRASFTYSAPSSSPLYPNGFTTGDPVFTRLAGRVSVAFAHRVDSDAAMALEGNVSVDAVLSGAGGWTRTVPLLAARPIQHGRSTIHVVLDLPALQALAVEAAAVTGTPTGDIRLAVAPRVELVGTVAGEPVRERFEPILAFSLDAAALRLSPSPEDAEVIAEIREGTVTVAASKASTIPMPFSHRLAVSSARTVGVVAGSTLLLLAAAVAYAGRRRGDGEPARITARYGRYLVPVRDASNPHHHPVVDLATIADLMRVAKHHEQLVLHHTADATHTYLVEVPGTTYRYIPIVIDDGAITGAESGQRSVLRSGAHAMRPRHHRKARSDAATRG